jgi:hypothetical protein
MVGWVSLRLIRIYQADSVNELNQVEWVKSVKWIGLWQSGSTLGGIYRVMNRGDRREPIFKDDLDRRRFLETLSEACVKTGWKRTLKEIERTKRSVAARPAAAPVVSVTQAVLDPILSVEERARGGVGAKGPPQPLYRPAPGFCLSAKSPAATTTRFSVLREIACEIASFCCARC